MVAATKTAKANGTTAPAKAAAKEPKEAKPAKEPKEAKPAKEPKQPKEAKPRPKPDPTHTVYVNSAQFKKLLTQAVNGDYLEKMAVIEAKYQVDGKCNKKNPAFVKEKRTFEFGHRKIALTPEAVTALAITSQRLFVDLLEHLFAVVDGKHTSLTKSALEDAARAMNNPADATADDGKNKDYAPAYARLWAALGAADAKGPSKFRTIASKLVKNVWSTFNEDGSYACQCYAEFDGRFNALVEKLVAGFGALGYDTLVRLRPVTADVAMDVFGSVLVAVDMGDFARRNRGDVTTRIETLRTDKETARLAAFYPDAKKQAEVAKKLAAKRKEIAAHKKKLADLKLKHFKELLDKKPAKPSDAEAKAFADMKEKLKAAEKTVKEAIKADEEALRELLKKPTTA